MLPHPHEALLPIVVIAVAALVGLGAAWVLNRRREVAGRAPPHRVLPEHGAAPSPEALAQTRQTALGFSLGVVVAVSGLAAWLFSHSGTHVFDDAVELPSAAASDLDAALGLLHRSTEHPAIPRSRQEPPEARLRELAEAAGKSPADVAIHLRWIRDLLRFGRARDALAAAEEALRANPGDLRLRTYAAVARAASGDYQAGARELTALNEQHPDLPEAWLWRGMLALRAGQVDAARAAWTRFIAVAPDAKQRERVRSLLEGEGAPMPW